MNHIDINLRDIPNLLLVILFLPAILIVYLFWVMWAKADYYPDGQEEEKEVP